MEFFEQDGTPKTKDGRKMIVTPDALERVATNGLRRILNCVPPPPRCDTCCQTSRPCEDCNTQRQSSWDDTGRHDQNNLVIWKPLFHTCDVESLNAVQTNFAQSGNIAPAYATARYFEGITRHNSGTVWCVESYSKE